MQNFTENKFLMYYYSKSSCLQILDRRRMEALEIAREKRTFEEVLKVQKKASEKQKLDDLRKLCVCTI
jgi:hypothetical protein